MLGNPEMLKPQEDFGRAFFFLIPKRMCNFGRSAQDGLQIIKTASCAKNEGQPKI